MSKKRAIRNTKGFKKKAGTGVKRSPAAPVLAAAYASELRLDGDTLGRKFRVVKSRDDLIEDFGPCPDCAHGGLSDDHYVCMKLPHFWDDHDQFHGEEAFPHAELYKIRTPGFSSEVSFYHCDSFDQHPSKSSIIATDKIIELQEDKLGRKFRIVNRRLATTPEFGPCPRCAYSILDTGRYCCEKLPHHWDEYGEFHGEPAFPSNKLREEYQLDHSRHEGFYFYKCGGFAKDKLVPS